MCIYLCILATLVILGGAKRAINVTTPNENSDRCLFLSTYTPEAGFELRASISPSPSPSNESSWAISNEYQCHKMAPDPTWIALGTQAYAGLARTGRYTSISMYTMFTLCRAEVSAGTQQHRHVYR